MKIVFTGERSRGAPLTWGQRHVRRTASASSQVRVLDLPGLPVPRVADALAQLVGRHEALRTRLAGEDEQRVSDHGTLAVDCGPALSADELTGPFDDQEEWPLRVGLVTAGPPDGAAVRQVVLVSGPLAVDHNGAEIVVKDLGLLLRGALPVRSAAQPADDAAFQRSVSGTRLTSRAVRFWTDELRRVEPPPVGPPGTAWSVTLRSSAMDVAAHSIAARHGVSAATVYLAATAAVVGTLAGSRVTGLRAVVSNRFYPDRRDVVATIAQDGVVVLDLAVPSFGELVQQAWRMTMRSHRFARYDPDAMASAVDTDSFPCFDDSRLARRDWALPSEAKLRAVAEGSTLTSSAASAGGLALAVDGSGASARADTMARSDLGSCLSALESLLVTAAFRDVAMGELGALVARPPGSVVPPA
ncbi:MAG: hypothetical protein GEV28_30240 [Actinophytocola sp.]|uniref:hypothetical protein n=1 Tax=Actinophytocola sp. TaxID=1872138 RepID=UPI0013289F35|nr:hypothetical protein [Actinophytocola sp.]MPZ84438.1 hypothetical protein [Actinophytocola sp.]